MATIAPPMKERKNLLFPHFRDALRENPDATAALPTSTYHRYANGELPATLEWFIQYPEMIRALLADAESMTESERKAFRAAIRARARAAKSRRQS